MATNDSSRSKVGSKREVAPGKWVIRVQAGFRADGHVRRVSRTVHGTETEADIVIAQLARELGVSQAAHAGVTLDMYYWGVFRDSPSNRGKPRSKASLREYDGQMDNYISPVLGSIDISENNPRHDAQLHRALGRAGKDQDDAARRHAPSLRRRLGDGGALPPPRHRAQGQAGARGAVEYPEAAEALRRLAASDDRADLVMNAYLILGLSGLRKEEALAVRPCDLKVTTTYDFATGQPTVSEYIEVCRAYTDEDGVKETKNAHSVRTVPVLFVGRERLHQIMDELRPSITVEGGTSVTEQLREWSGQRIVNMRGDNLVRAWRRMCTRHDLRYIPPRPCATRTRPSWRRPRSTPEHHGSARPYGPGDKLPPLHQTGPAQREKAARQVGAPSKIVEGGGANGGFNGSVSSARHLKRRSLGPLPAKCIKTPPAAHKRQGA